MCSVAVALRPEGQDRRSARRTLALHHYLNPHVANQSHRCPAVVSTCVSVLRPSSLSWPGSSAAWGRRDARRWLAIHWLGTHSCRAGTHVVRHCRQALISADHGCCCLFFPDFFFCGVRAPHPAPSNIGGCRARLPRLGNGKVGPHPPPPFSLPVRRPRIIVSALAARHTKPANSPRAGRRFFFPRPFLFHFRTGAIAGAALCAHTVTRTLCSTHCAPHTVTRTPTLMHRSVAARRPPAASRPGAVETARVKCVKPDFAGRQACTGRGRRQERRHMTALPGKRSWPEAQD